MELLAFLPTNWECNGITLFVHGRLNMDTIPDDNTYSGLRS